MDVTGRQLERSGNEAGLLAHRIRSGSLRRHNVAMAAWLGHKPSFEVTSSKGDFFFFTRNAPNRVKIYTAADLLDQKMPDWERVNLSDQEWATVIKPGVEDNHIRQCFTVYMSDSQLDIPYSDVALVTDNALVKQLRNECHLRREYLTCPKVKELVTQILEGKLIKKYLNFELNNFDAITLYNCARKGKKMSSDYLTRLMLDLTVGQEPKTNLDRTIAWLLK